MIQELLGGSNVGVIGGERSKPASGDGAAASSATPENLRCPRCDSANTKFCYYNNYNLTQPRHFCKTCRRYWTKGGALRNVPIGGGCRKNKPTTIVGKSSAAGKFKTAPSETAKTGLFPALEHSASPILWASSQNSHFLSLLRPNQNPSHLQNECENLLFGLNSESGIGSNAQALGLDPFGPAHLLSNPLYRNQTLSGQGQNLGLQEVYQRLRSSSASCYPEHAPLILESAPVAAAGELGFWNPTLSWPTDHMPTINGGAYP